jgi:surfactin synthase thioesterase subunit
VRLICLPYAGGGAAAWHPWLPLLPNWIELAMVQLPGREGRLREPPLTRMEHAIDALVPALHTLTDLPYALFGHSMGALMAFALARALRADGAPAPALLVVSGRRAPQLIDPESPIHTLADGPFVGALIRRYNAIPRPLLEDVELLRLFLPAVRADLEMLETYTYQPAPPLNSPILALGGRDDSRATPDDLAAWQSQTRSAFRTQHFPGGHFYINPERAALVQTIIATLAEAMPQNRTEQDLATERSAA